MKSILCPRRVVALLCLSSFSTALMAQKSPQQLEEMRQKVLSDPKVEHVTISPNRQTPSFLTLKADGYAKDQARAALDKYLSLRSGVDYLVADKETRLYNNIEIVEFQQYYKGVKVDRAKFKAFVRNGKVAFYNGAWYDVPGGLSVTPALDRAKALGFAHARVNARKYATEEIQERINAERDERVKAELQKELAAAAPKGELVIAQDFSKEKVVQVKLAYKFDIYAAEPLSRSWVYVDANNGAILLVDAIIKHAGKPGPTSTSSLTSVQTRYAGTRNIYVKQVSGTDPQSGLLLQSSHPTTEVYLPGAQTWTLMDDTRGGGIETYDLNGVGGLPISLGAVYTQGKSFTDVDGSWTLSEHKRGGGEDGALEAENDDIAWDAHWGAEMVYDYWKNKQNRLSYDNNNAKIKSFVHYGPAYDNAFWNGSVMTYGDGSGPAAGGFKALTSLDVCGHEIGHGICSYTSDLVYAKESGAMNEALSDIWAACVEYYAIKNIDPALASVYKPFYIGEQIAGDPSRPLRRMDNPKAEGNPDTYGGTNWKNPDCSPTLVNDQCGVHNNSGVLNKWFYLLTVGSHAGSGPDAAFAGEDDGINDSGNAYAVTGLGFDVSEKIVYLTEMLLTSTATYAEAREVSISVATELSGNPCSAMVETVTNAWYGVGVGNKFVKPCSVTYGFIFQPGAAVTEASTPGGCNSSKVFNVPVLLPANSTATVSVSGTATLGQDYALSATSLSNTTSELSKQTIQVTIKNDGMVEGDEYVDLKIAVSNTGASPANSTYKLTLLDDDVVPVIGNSEKTLLSETFTRADGFADPSGWTEVLEMPESANGDPLATGKNQWGVFDNKLAITGKDGATGLAFPNGTYNNASESHTLIKSSLIDARGLSSVSIKFDYTVQGEVDAQGTDPESFPAFDYMALAYSLDGKDFVELNTGAFSQFSSLQPSGGTFNAQLPASLVNKQFYLAFRWSNDANAGGPVSVSIDNLEVKGAARKIENELNSNGRENLGAGQEIYFYSLQDQELLGKIKNGSSKDFGCTNVLVEKAGSNAFNLYEGRDGLHKVSDKVVRVEAGLIYKVSNTVTLYYTEEQLQSLELATGRSRTEFYVYHVADAAYTSASSRNTVKYTGIYTPIPGVGGSYTITFTDKVNGSYALGYPVSLLGQSQSVSRVGVTEIAKDWHFAPVYPNPGNTDLNLQLTSPVPQRLKIEISNMAGQLVYGQQTTIQAGASQLRIKTAILSSGSYQVKLLDEKGRTLNVQQYVKK